MIVLSSDCSASSKCKELKKRNVFGRLRGYIYHELLVKIYYPRFLHSNQVGKESCAVLEP